MTVQLGVGGLDGHWVAALGVDVALSFVRQRLLVRSHYAVNTIAKRC